MDALVDLLPEHSSLKRMDNQLRKVLDGSVGEWFDRHSIQSLYNGLFLTSASGRYLDLHGRDFGVSRRLDEDDDHYRERIVFEKLEYLTAHNLINIYGLTLYTYVDDFDIKDNVLTSDNPFIPSNNYISVADNDLISILDKKYVLDNSIYWLNDKGTVEYILNSNGKNVLNEYSKIYNMENIAGFFEGMSFIKKVRLDLPNAVDVRELFDGCTGLTNLTVDAPNASNINGLCGSCTALVDVNINMPLGYPATNPYDIFPVSSSVLKSVSIVMHSQMKSYWINRFSDSTNYPNLEYLCVNGEVVDL